MADGILYLDVDDEITSVAARVRGATERRVAIVLPYGSRVATSRINFRLLSRDAMTHEKRLSIVASDAAARALAASAGLPVFSSVAEYESSEEAPRPRAGATPAASAPAAASAATRADEPVVAPQPPLTGAAKRRKRTARAADESKSADAAAGAAAAEAASATVPEQIAVPFDDALTSAVPSVPLGSVRPQGTQSIDRPALQAPAAPRPRPPMARPIGAIDEGDSEPPRPFGPIGIGWLGRSSVILGLAVLALAALVGGVGAYLVLPSATVVVTPREEAIGPLRMTITADPNATVPDSAASVVPAETIPVDVNASGTYPATGKRVEEKAAKGVVRFDNYNPISTNTIPGGSIVSTQTDVRFQTDRSVRIPAASFDPATSTVTPASATVPVTAMVLGTSGNVPPNTITRVPPDENGTFLDVTNPNATAGGTHKEFPLVAEKDVTAAVAALTTALQTKFQARLADPTLVADGATVFPATGILGPPTNAVDPTTLVGQQVATFDLAATASGTVMAVKTDAVRTIAEQRLAATVTPGRVLVDGSGQIQTDQGVVQGTTISFAVVATARQVQQLDPVAIRDAIKGHALADAGQILDGFGTWDIAVWPEWVKTIPTIDARLDVRVAQPNTQGQGASASPSASSGAPSSSP